MRGYLASSIGVACAAALALPLVVPQDVRAAVPSAPAAESAGAVPGSTQSLPLTSLATDRAGGGATAQGLTRREVRPFSLVGVVWDDPAAVLNGRVQVRTRAAGTGTWSGWQDVDTHNQEHAADTGTPERAAAEVRGSTAPLWVGNSDAVEIRVESAPPETPETSGHDQSAPSGDDSARGAGPEAGTTVDFGTTAATTATQVMARQTATATGNQTAAHSHP
ncbi:N-acetylmuramoyl-L-alanine amidase, partial [Streptomyces sp. YC537]|nr:N-acetylmuramoyl-L-alanine amidase [Streptomyces boluensis]